MVQTLYNNIINQLKLQEHQITVHHNIGQTEKEYKENPER
mgnify:CR=1 FL=1